MSFSRVTRNKQSGLAALLMTLLGTTTVIAGHSFPDAHVSLHVQATQKGLCAPNLPLDPCSDYQTEWPTGASSAIYVILDNVSSISSVSFGLEYDNTPGTGVDLFGWQSCGTVEFPLTGPEGEWPASGSGNQVVWPAQLDCQPARTVAGSFYIYAYSHDVFRVGSAPNSLFAITDCEQVNTVLLDPFSGGAVVYSDSGYVGENPCSRVLDRCTQSARFLEFGAVVVGESSVREFEIYNAEGGRFEGLIPWLFCDHFTLISQVGPFTLSHGATHLVQIEFEPTAPGDHICTMELFDFCESVELFGTALASTGMPGSDSGASAGPALLTVSPNPFRTQVQIELSLRARRELALNVFDVKGGLVATLAQGVIEPGARSFVWNGRTLAGSKARAGVYFIRVIGEETNLSQKIFLIH